MTDEQMQELERRQQNGLDKPLVDMDQQVPQAITGTAKPASFDAVNTEDIPEEDFSDVPDNSAPEVPGGAPEMEPDDSFLDESAQVEQPGTVKATAPFNQSFQQKYQAALEKQRQDNLDKYNTTSDASSGLRDKANLLRAFQGIIQGAGQAANPNFKSDMSVADDLTKQAQEKLAEFHKFNSDTKQNEATAASSQLANTRAVGLGLDINDKQQLMDPTSTSSKYLQERQIAKQHSLPLNQQVDPAVIRKISGYDLLKLNTSNSQDLRQQMLDLGKDSLAFRKVSTGERLAQSADSLGLKHDKFKNTLVQQDELTPAQVKELEPIDDGLNQIARIEKLFPKVKQFMGKYASNIEEAKKYVPNLEKNPDFVEMVQRTGDQLSSYINSISGTAVSEAEAARLKQNIPNIQDKPQEFVRKINTWKSILGDKRTIKLGNIQRSGRDTSALKTPVLPARPQSEDSVTIQLPNGNVGKVKKSAAQKYLDQGGIIVTPKDQDNFDE